MPFRLGAGSRLVLVAGMVSAPEPSGKKICELVVYGTKGSFCRVHPGVTEPINCRYLEAEKAPAKPRECTVLSGHKSTWPRAGTALMVQFRPPVVTQPDVPLGMICTPTSAVAKGLSKNSEPILLRKKKS